MSRYLPAAAALVLLLVAGLVHGFWTDRWTVSKATAEAAVRLQHLPLAVGDWQGENVEVDTRETEAITGHLYRRYVNRSNGNQVTIVLLCGLPGPVSIHTPDVCYRAGGFDVAEPVKVKVAAEPPGPDGEFWAADLHKATATEEVRQRIYWSWSATGAWTAPDDDPRGLFAGQPVLFKLYAVRDLAAGDKLRDDDPCAELLRQLMPQMKKTLFARP
jgi:hypothetical protein